MDVLESLLYVYGIIAVITGVFYGCYKLGLFTKK